MYISILRIGIWLTLTVTFITKAMEIMERNVVKISSSQSCQKDVNNVLLLQKGHPIRYNSDKLLQLREKVVHHNKYKIIDSQACVTIRKLRINHRAC